MARRYEGTLAGILIEPSRWRLLARCRDRAAILALEPPEQAEAGPAAWAGAVAQAVRGQRLRPGMPVLALPGDWCLAAPVATDGLLRRHRHEGLTYRLEEKLPLDAEALVADFIPSGQTALGVAVEAERVRPILEALEAVEIPIGSICPAPILAVQRLITQGGDERPDVVLLGDGEAAEDADADASGTCGDGGTAGGSGGVDVFALNAAGALRPQRWMRVSSRGHDLLAAVRRQAIEADRDVVVQCHGVGPQTRAAIESLDGIETVTERSESPQQLLAEQAAAIAIRDEPPLLELRRGRLAPVDILQRLRRPLQAAAMAVVVLLLAVTATSLWRAEQYAAMTERIEQRQAAVFREALPNQPVPQAPLSRLRAEAQQMEGLRGSRGPGAALPQRVPATRLLHETLTRLPEDEQLPFRLLELRLDGQRLYLDGQARSHGEADRIAAKLREAEALGIEAPRTDSLDDRGVSFTLTGEPVLEGEVGR